MPANDWPPAIFLMGPTASGKTDLAVALCEHLPCEIISVDSALVYRGMDIGSAKPDAALLARAPHRLIDIRDPAQAYSAAEFRDEALQAMAEISAAGRIPLLVGGTMLYFKALLEGLAELPAADPEVRARIDAMAEQGGWPAVHTELAKVDPVSAARLNPNDAQRLQRALEVFLVSGRSLTDWQREQVKPDNGRPFNTQLPYRILQVAIAPQERCVLHHRIERRFRQMLSQGFVAEVERLMQRGDLHENLPAIRAVGYRQVWQYLQGDGDEVQMIERGIAATRQLAKRQITWLRSWPELFWLLTDETGQLLALQEPEGTQSAAGEPLDLLLQLCQRYLQVPG